MVLQGCTDGGCEHKPWHACVQIHSLYMYICVYLHTHKNMCIYIYIYIIYYTSIYIYIYTYIHTHTYTYTYVSLALCLSLSLALSLSLWLRLSVSLSFLFSFLGSACQNKVPRRGAFKLGGFRRRRLLGHQREWSRSTLSRGKARPKCKHLDSSWHPESITTVLHPLQHTERGPGNRLNHGTQEKCVASSLWSSK